MDELGRQADLIIRATEKTIVQAQVDLGHIFREAKVVCQRIGTPFMTWLKGRGIGQRAANRAMELARKHQSLVESDWTRVSTFEHLSFRQALAFGKPPASPSGRRRPPGGGGDGAAGRSDEPEFAPPDFAHLLHHMAQQWSPERIERYQPTDDQLDMLAEDTPQLLRAIIEMLEGARGRYRLPQHRDDTGPRSRRVGATGRRAGRTGPCRPMTC